jgi:hypothetical protein
MATYKDILYKMEDNETWTEWSKRVPDNDEDKLDYIGETIYDICIWDGKENAYKITDMLIELGVEQLIPLLENEELLNAKIEEAYREIRDKCDAENPPICDEKEKEKEEEDDDDYKQPVVTLTVAEMIEALSKLPPDAKLVMTESGFYSNSEFAEVMLPRPYKVENGRWECDLPTGTQVYIIGHSHQSY